MLALRSPILLFPSFFHHSLNGSGLYSQYISNTCPNHSQIRSKCVERFPTISQKQNSIFNCFHNYILENKYNRLFSVNVETVNSVEFENEEIFNLFNGTYNGKLMSIWNPEKHQTLINYKNGDKRRTLLHIVSLQGFTSNVEFLIKNGAKVSEKDSSGDTPLHSASRGGRLQVAQILVNEFNLDINEVNQSNKTSLHLAVFKRYHELAQFYISKNCLVNVQDKDGKTPLHYAVTNCDKEIINSLANADADPNIQDKDGHTPLHLAVRSRNIVCISFLLEAFQGKINFEIKNKYDCTPLFLATSFNLIPAVYELILKGADVNTVSFQSSLYHSAAKRDHLEVMQIIYENTNLPLDTVDQFHKTAFHIAASHGSNRVCDFIRMEVSHSKEMFDDFGSTPIHYALIYENPDLALNLLIPPLNNIDVVHPDFKRTLLHIASMRGYTHVVNYLIKNGADVNYLDLDGWSPLHFACFSKSPNTVSFLLSNGSDPSIPTKNLHTPLNISISYKDIQSVKLLLGHKNYNKAQPDLKNRTPLHFAVRSMSLEICQLLLSEMTTEELTHSINSQDSKYGNTPLHIAIICEDVKMSILLLKYGSSLNIKNSFSLTPLQLAKNIYPKDSLIIKILETAEKTLPPIPSPSTSPNIPVYSFNPKAINIMAKSFGGIEYLYPFKPDDIQKKNSSFSSK